MPRAASELPSALLYLFLGAIWKPSSSDVVSFDWLLNSRSTAVGVLTYELRAPSIGIRGSLFVSEINNNRSALAALKGGNVDVARDVKRADQVQALEEDMEVEADHDLHSATGEVGFAGHVPRKIRSRAFNSIFMKATPNQGSFRVSSAVKRNVFPPDTCTRRSARSLVLEDQHTASVSKHWTAFLVRAPLVKLCVRPQFPA